MQPNRRGFLSLLGVGTAAAPLAAKAAAESEVSKLMQMSINGVGMGSGIGLSGGDPGFPDELGDVSYGKRLIDAADYIKTFGLPKVVEVTLRDQAKYVHGLDPDIACKQSWSMSVKIMTQRERNYQRSLQRIEMSGWTQRGRTALKKVLGFDFPW